MAAREVATAVQADDRRPLPGGRSLRVVRTLEGLPSIREAWDILGPKQVIADLDFYAATVANDPKVIRPHVILLERDGAPEAMAVARLEQLELDHRIGYRTIYKPKVRALTVVFGGILGDPAEETFGYLLDELRRALDAGEGDVAIFSYLPVDSTEFRLAATKPPFLARQHAVRSGIHWQLDLPESVDEITRSLAKKSQKNLRYAENKMRREFGDTFRIRVFKDTAEIDEFFHDVETIAAKTYQRALGVSFGDTPAHRARTRVGLEHGWFRGYVLYLGGEPRAFWHGERYRGTFRVGTPGFDPEYASYGVGTHLMLHMIDDLCRDQEVSVLDFGVGDAEYKQRFCNRQSGAANVIVFSRSARGAWLNFTLTVAARTMALLRSLARRQGVVASTKKRWRDRLSRPTARQS